MQQLIDVCVVYMLSCVSYIFKRMHFVVFL